MRILGLVGLLILGCNDRRLPIETSDGGIVNNLDLSRKTDLRNAPDMARKEILLVHYAFSNNEPFKDKSGSGNHAQVYGVKIVNSPNGNVAEFDGDSYLKIRYSPEFDFSKGVKVEIDGLSSARYNNFVSVPSPLEMVNIISYGDSDGFGNPPYSWILNQSRSFILNGEFKEHDEYEFAMAPDCNSKNWELKRLRTKTLLELNKPQNLVAIFREKDSNASMALDEKIVDSREQKSICGNVRTDICIGVNCVDSIPITEYGYDNLFKGSMRELRIYKLE